MQPKQQVLLMITLSMSTAAMAHNGNHAILSMFDLFMHALSYAAPLLLLAIPVVAQPLFHRHISITRSGQQQ